MRSRSHDEESVRRAALFIVILPFPPPHMFPRQPRRQSRAGSPTPTSPGRATSTGCWNGGFVRNIYKYYVAYRLTLDAQAEVENAKKQVVVPKS